MKLKEITKRNAKRVLRFDDTREVVTSGFRCEICGEIFLQKHDALIHQYEVCLPKTGTKKLTPGEKEPTHGSQPRADTPLAAQPARDTTTPDRTRSKLFGNPD